MRRDLPELDEATARGPAATRRTRSCDRDALLLVLALLDLLGRDLRRVGRRGDLRASCACRPKPARATISPKPCRTSTAGDLAQARQIADRAEDRHHRGSVHARTRRVTRLWRSPVALARVGSGAASLPARGDAAPRTGAGAGVARASRTRSRGPSPTRSARTCLQSSYAAALPAHRGVAHCCGSASGARRLRRRVLGGGAGPRLRPRAARRRVPGLHRSSPEPSTHTYVPCVQHVAGR